MQKRDEQLQGCFIDEETQTPHHTQEIELNIEITKKINMHLPANQLRTARRPDNMTPRTFFLDRPFYLLKEELNESYQQALTTVTTHKVRQRVENANNLSLSQYFSQRKFQCVYNRLSTYREDCRSFIGKLKGVDYLIDYNWKCFKQLEMELEIHSERTSLPHRIDSDFQSGNLCRAYIKRQDEQTFYYLLIENDVNTYGYNNWFFFRYRNQGKGTVKFKIVNMIKKTMFFNQGMLISVFSLRKKMEERIGWFKGGDNINFSHINLKRSHHNQDQYFSLYFEYTFEYDSDEVYFALNQPYTYSRLVNTLTNLQQNNFGSQKVTVQVKTLTYSISNNIIPAIKFFKPDYTYENCILVLARQHPCETMGSFIAEALMKELTQSSLIQDWILDEFEVIVIPMVNPDGVIHGMSRVNMAGLDLNRHWGEHIIKELTPETLKIKNYIISLSKKRKIKYMFDLHGHGKKLNSFFFCCKNGDKQHQNYRLMSMAMNKFEQRFSIESCTYGLSKDKESTIRSMVNSMGIRHSYTLETSLYGWRDKDNIIHSFTEQDYRSIARNLLKCIVLIEGSNNLTISLLGTTKDAVIAEMTPLMDTIEKNQQLLLQNQTNVSDSDPEGDRLDMKELLSKCSNKIIKKRIQESINADRRQFLKKQKRMSTAERQSRKNINLKQSLGNQIHLSTRLTTSHKNRILSRQEKEYLCNTDNTHNKNATISNHINHKAIMGERWKERKKDKLKIQKKKQLVQSLNLTRPKLRSRIKTEAIPVHREHEIRKKFTLKTFTQARRVATEVIDLEQCKQIKKQTKGFHERLLQQEQIMKEVREGTHNHLLTDTMSIMKIVPQSKNSSFVKHVSSDPKKEKIYLRNKDKHQEDEQGVKSEREEGVFDLKNIKRCQPIMPKFHHSRKIIKNTNSVFYYFPIL